MTSSATAAPPGESVFRRELGTWDQGRAGPTVLVLAGIHGNEPAGVQAVRAVLHELQQADVQIHGRLVALAGNLAALRQGRRYLGRDLNRQWTHPHLQALLRADPGADSAEDREQRELVACFQRVLATARGPVVFLDLHTSSAPGPPFLVLADTLDNRRTAMAAGVPIILGLEETIDGASMEWFSDRGIVNFAVEGGQHQAPDTAANLAAVVWLTLAQVGALRAAAVDLAPHRQRIAAAVGDAPRIVEIIHRQAIAAGDGFRMAPGFVNFQPVERGCRLAEDQRGAIAARVPGRVLLPLYQGLGDDGFFLGRDVRPFWLGLAAALRRLHLDRVVHWLPGVRRDPDDRDSILVDPRVARWLVTELFHLLGFRRERRRGDRLRFSRRWSLAHNRLLRPR